MIEARAPQKMIAIEESFAARRKDPEYLKAYQAREDEFSRAAAAAMRLRISFEPAPAKRIAKGI